MLTLTLVFCLAADPTRCMERQVESPSIAACMIGGQQQGADLLATMLPGWRLASWRCRAGRPEGGA